MTPESQAEKIVRRAIEEAQTLARQNWRNGVLERLAFYHGDHKGPMIDGIATMPAGEVTLPNTQYLVRYMGKAWETKQVMPVYMPLLRRFADLMATLFHRTPQFRPVLNGKEVADADLQRCRDLLDEVEFEQRGKFAQRMCQALSCCFAAPRYYRGRMYLDIVTPDDVDVVQDPLNPGVAADCLAISTRLPDTADTVRATASKRITWTRETTPEGDYWGCYFTDQYGRPLPNPYFPDEANPYGRLPVVPLYSERPEGTIFPTLDDTMLAAQVAADIGWTHIFTLIRMHGGTGIRTGDNDEMGVGELPIGALRFMDLPAGGDFKWVELKMNLQEVIQSLTQLLKTSAGLRGIPTDAIDIEGAKVIDALSAASKQMDRLDLIEIREDQEPLWERQVRDLWKLLVTVNNYHRPDRRIDPEIELEVIWAQPEMPTDRQSEAQAAAIEIANGTTSPVDIIVQRKRIPRAEAELEYARNLRERAMGQEAPAPEVPA